MPDDPEELRRKRIREQIMRLVPSRYKISAYQLFNDTTCNITYEDFRGVLEELRAEGKIHITPPADLEADDETRPAFELIQTA